MAIAVAGLLLLVTLVPAAVALAALASAVRSDRAPASLSVEAATARVTMRWPYNVLSVRQSVEFDVASIQNAYVDPAVRKRSRGTFRIGTSGFPGGPIAGIFLGDGETQFWSVRNDRALVVDFTRGSRFDRLVVEVEDPSGAAHTLMSAR